MTPRCLVVFIATAGARAGSASPTYAAVTAFGALGSRDGALLDFGPLANRSVGNGHTGSTNATRSHPTGNLLRSSRLDPARRALLPENGHFIPLGCCLRCDRRYAIVRVRIAFDRATNWRPGLICARLLGLAITWAYLFFLCR